MFLAPLLLAAAVLAANPAAARRRSSPPATVVLDGERTSVRWTDGDGFRILSGPRRGASARLRGVNALEAYGPVHRFAGMSGDRLLALARTTSSLAAAREWRCTADGPRDAYRRLLVDCPDAAEALVRAGHAMVFAIDRPPEPALVEAQRAAQRERAGMWAGGAPPLVPTSLHSAAERDPSGGGYDRIADTRTGETAVRRHGRTYAVCEEVCVGEGAERACMTYVPYERRYRDRPACLLPAPEGRRREASPRSRALP